MYKKLLFLLVFSLVACISQSNYSGSLPPNCDWQMVTKVYDGDTVKLANGSRVRYIGIDALEMNEDPINPSAIKATQENEKLVLNKNVCLIKDSQTDNEDKYGRLLRYLYLENGTFVNKNLIEGGWATAYTVFSFSKKEEFIQAEKYAQEKQLEVWGVENNNQNRNETISPVQAKGHYGESAMVHFTVLSSHDSGKAIFLNSETNYQSTKNFTVVIFYNSKTTFVKTGIDDPAKYYLHKTINVRGKIQKYQEKPEIIVSSPNAITLSP